ncbi:hypothetical protein HK104_001891 [Borealophlyctis nickersoniae]|nr:hypothetical protein HK104_001891 [Borealophlyctis nickersoniae]
MTGAWENVKKHTRRLSDTFRRSPTKAHPPVHFEDPEEPESITLRLGNVQLVYSGNEWRFDHSANHTDHDGTGTVTLPSRAMQDLAEKNRVLEGENRLLKLKVNVLLDMLAVSKLDVLQLQEKNGAY